MFRINYVGTEITKVDVVDTGYWPWAADGFDKSKLGDPIELPETIQLHLSNDSTLSFYGRNDDFVIEIAPSTEK